MKEKEKDIVEMKIKKDWNNLINSQIRERTFKKKIKGKMEKEEKEQNKRKKKKENLIWNNFVLSFL